MKKSSALKVPKNNKKRHRNDNDTFKEQIFISSMSTATLKAFSPLKTNKKKSMTEANDSLGEDDREGRKKHK